MDNRQLLQNIKKCRTIAKDEGLTKEERKMARELVITLSGALVFAVIWGLFVGDNINI